MFTSITNRHDDESHHALLRVLKQETDRCGGISFARFMDLALYHPDGGYYEQPQRVIGRAGDFFTSVSVGPLFGQLLTAVFTQWLKTMDNRRNTILEAGAHDGRLALDILEALEGRPETAPPGLEYWILEPSLHRRKRQEKLLRRFKTQVRWFNSWTTVRQYCDKRGQPLTGVLFSNELLDAYPVHRLGWDAGRREWFEWLVGMPEGELHWRRGPLSSPALAHAAAKRKEKVLNPTDDFSGWPELPDELLAVLPHEFTTEICPRARTWWGEAAALLAEGVLLTLDYGLEVEEFFTPQRARGTCRGYHEHRLEPDLLARPGRMDLTSHVNFTDLIRAGEAEGLRTERWETQQQFLTRTLLEEWPGKGTDFSPEQVRQFQTLTHPAQLGAKFKALVQRRKPDRVHS